MWKEERSGISKYLELRPKKLLCLGHPKDIFIDFFGEGQVCRERTNEESRTKNNDGRVERKVIGLPASGCCRQHLYICVGSSVSH